MNPALSPQDFEKLSTFIYSELGIKMPETKMPMLVSRLRKRLRALELASFGEYCAYLFSPAGMADEMVHLINAVTTNKTDFFREPNHFTFLTNQAIPALLETREFTHRQPLRIWSAGCSTGEEPYTLAMVLSEYQENFPHFKFEILATDISLRVLEIARRAVYPMERIEPVPYICKKKYILRGRGKRATEVRMSSELRSHIRFGRLNFMDDDFGLPYNVDIIFCRNVIIYFDNDTQQQLMWKFSQNLRDDGFLFLGHSETLHGYSTPFVQVAPTVYRHNHEEE